jgi:quercetin dioxygenase-like cupin family protein
VRPPPQTSFGIVNRRHDDEEVKVSDTSIMKVDSRFSPKGEMGQTYLAGGIQVAMRLWDDEQPSDPKPPVSRDYETVGYVISGRAELHSEGQMVILEPGNSWVVPKGASHTYRILEPFTAVEATSPPAVAHGRDE